MVGAYHAGCRVLSGSECQRCHSFHAVQFTQRRPLQDFFEARRHRSRTAASGSTYRNCGSTFRHCACDRTAFDHLRTSDFLYLDGSGAYGSLDRRSLFPAANGCPGDCRDRYLRRVDGIDAIRTDRHRGRIRGNDYAMNRRNFLGVAGAAALLPEFSHAQAGEGFITDVDGIKVGHFTETRRPTGCTVVLCERGAVGGVEVRGSAPGTRETDLLKPTNLVDKVNAIVLSGGSAFGLDTATGVMRYLE